MVATETSRVEVTHPSVAPSAISAPPVATTTSAGGQTTVAPPQSAGAFLDKDCTAARSDTAYDLLHVRVESLPSHYRLTAQYSGDTFQHDILVSFALGAARYLVTAELFEDGKGVARIAGTDSSEDIFLDPPQTITPGLVDLTVQNDQIGGLDGTSFDVTVVLKVDGSEIETCQ